MTREEARDFIVDISYTLGNTSVEYLTEKHGEKMREAVKTLDQDSTTNNDLRADAISRKTVIDELKRYFHDEYYQRTSIQDCRDCFIEDVLNHLPSVMPTNKECVDDISEDRIFLKIDKIKELLDDCSLMERNALKKIREVIEE